MLDQLVQVHPHHRAFINLRLTIAGVLTKEFRERSEAALSGIPAVSATE